MSAEKISASEMVQSLTGFEEIAIEEHMGVDPYSDFQTKPLRVLRALVFVQKTREGAKPRDAKNHAMNLSMQSVQDSFEDETDEVMEDEPVTEAGKDSSATSEQQKN